LKYNDLEAFGQLVIQNNKVNKRSFGDKKIMILCAGGE
jgi:hypothetical protein